MGKSLITKARDRKTYNITCFDDQCLFSAKIGDY